MSGPKPPEWEPEEPDSVNEAPHQPDSDSATADAPEPGGEPGPDDELEPFDDGAEPAADQTGQTDAYSRAYSAPESEHFMSGPYLPADLRLYDYDTFDESADAEDEHGAPRWPWIVGVAAIVAAIALVVSVSLLFAGTDTSKLANPNTTTVPSTPPMQDEITTTK
ncbi:membrane protein, partial [Mycobacterium nebraskense]